MLISNLSRDERSVLATYLTPRDVNNAAAATPEFANLPLPKNTVPYCIACMKEKNCFDEDIIPVCNEYREIYGIDRFLKVIPSVGLKEGFKGGNWQLLIKPDENDEFSLHSYELRQYPDGWKWKTGRIDEYPFNIYHLGNDVSEYRIVVQVRWTLWHPNDANPITLENVEDVLKEMGRFVEPKSKYDPIAWSMNIMYNRFRDAPDNPPDTDHITLIIQTEIVIEWPHAQRVEAPKQEKWFPSTEELKPEEIEENGLVSIWQDPNLVPKPKRVTYEVARHDFPGGMVPELFKPPS